MLKITNQKIFIFNIRINNCHNDFGVGVSTKRHLCDANKNKTYVLLKQSPWGGAVVRLRDSDTCKFNSVTTASAI